MAYTNNDIMDKLLIMSMMQESMKQDVRTIKEQATKTNGRVNTIEMWMNGIQAIDSYKREQSNDQRHSSSRASETRWFQNEKLVGGVVAVLLAIAGVIGYAAATGNHP